MPTIFLPFFYRFSSDRILPFFQAEFYFFFIISFSGGILSGIVLDQWFLHIRRDACTIGQEWLLRYLLFYILPQSSGDFDPEAHAELKKPPNRSEISTRRNFRKLCISMRTKVMVRNHIRSLQRVIQNEILLIRRKNVGLPDD